MTNADYFSTVATEIQLIAQSIWSEI